MTSSTDTLSASLEDYLEAIYHTVAEKQVARSKDIAARLNVHGSSVTGALKALKERGLIHYAPYEVVRLTEEGEARGREIVRRHEALHDFFVKVLTIEQETADKAACEMEHAMPREVLDRFVKFLRFVETCPRSGARWIDGFGYFCRNGPDHGDCAQCLEESLDEVRSGGEGRGCSVRE